MNATSEVAETFESTFHAHYERIARVIGRIVRDPARAEELAVEVFLKWSRNPAAHGGHAEGWLYRTAVRTGLDDLRRRARRERYESLFRRLRRSDPDPEQLHASRQEQNRVRLVLASLSGRQAELLLLRRGSQLRGDRGCARVESGFSGDTSLPRPRGVSKGVRETIWRAMTE